MIPAPVKIWPMPAIPEIEAFAAEDRASPRTWANTAHRQHHRRQRNADVVCPEEHPEGLDLCKVVMGSVQRHHKEYQHSQQEQMGVDLTQRRHASEATVLGKLLVKDAAHHSGNGIGQGDIQVLFHQF